LGVLVPAAARSQYEIEIHGTGFKRIALKVREPEIAGSGSGLRQAADEARETLGRDLIYSGLFHVMDAWGNPYLPRGVSRAWNVANETPERQPHEIAAAWSLEAGQLQAEMRLLDGLGTQITGKRYRVDAAGVRGAMHHFADEVVKRLTGVDGTAQTKIAFARLRGEVADIYTVDYDGFGERQVTNQKTLSHSPVWGPRRAWLAFTSYVESNPNLYRIDEGSNRLRALSRQPGLNTAPDWCQKRGLFALTLSHQGNAEVYTMREDGSGLKRLTHHPAIDTSPSWSPGGEQIAFTSDRSGVPQIYVMDGDGGNVRRLTYHNRYSDSPAWSPDGRWIAYVARWDGSIELRVMKPDGNDQRVVVGEGLNDSPSWGKDARHLVFSSLRGGARAIYVVDIYTGLERRLTTGAQDAITPAWSRD
jgi:TolB protein